MDDDGNIEAEAAIEPAHQAALTHALARAEAVGHAAAPEEALISAETEKLALETRHLSLGYFNERLSVTLKVMAIALGAVVEPFSAPSSLSQRGVTGDVLAGDVMERLASMTRLVNAQSLRTSSDVAGDRADRVRVEIPETGVSVGELWRALRDWLGHERRVDGSLRETPDGRVELVARIVGHDPVSATGAPGDPDQLETSLAQQLFRAILQGSSTQISAAPQRNGGVAALDFFRSANERGAIQPAPPSPAGRPDRAGNAR